MITTKDHFSNGHKILILPIIPIKSDLPSSIYSSIFSLHVPASHQQHVYRSVHSMTKCKRLQIINSAPQAIMKYIIETLWNFIQQIPQKFTKLIHPRPHEIDSNTTLHKGHSRLANNRRGKKRKSFRSFMREESLSRRRRIQENSWKNGSAKMIRFSKKRENQRFLMSFEGDSFQDEHSKDNFTNEVPPPAMQIEPQSLQIFQDNNGLQISAISSQRRANEQQSRAFQSDEELLQLICGGQASPIADAAGNLSPNFSRRKDGKKWWQRVIQENSINNGRNRGIRSGFDREGRKDLQGHRIKVITLIDLTMDEDGPREYHIPLALPFNE